MDVPGNRELFFEMSLDLHCIASPQAKLLHINQRWEQLLGYTQEELKGGTFLEFIHPDDIAGTITAMEELNHSNAVANFSNRYRTKKGVYLVLDWNAIYNADEDLYYATARDITEQRGISLNLKKTNQILSAITDAHETYLASGMNRSWWDKMLSDVLQITGSEYGFIGAIEEDSAGRYLRTFAITDISWDESTRAFFESGREDGLEFRNLQTLFGQVILTEENVVANNVADDPRAGGRPPGHPPLNRFLGLALHGSSGLEGMIGVANRTEPYEDDLIQNLHPVVNFLGALVESHTRKRREEDTHKKLREVLELNSQILESSTSFIFALDLQGEFLHANRATRSNFNLQSEHAAKGVVSLTVLQKDRAWLNEQIKLVAGKGSVTLELEILSKSGGLLPCEFTVTGLTGPDGTMNGVLFVGFELSTRQRLAASAIETATLQSRVDVLRKRQSEDALVSSCVEYLLNCNSMDETQEIIFQHLKQLYPEGVVELFRFDPEAEVLELLWPKSEEIPPMFPVADCWSMRSRQPHSWFEGSSHMRCSHTTTSDATMIACAPLRSYQNIFGMVSIQFRQSIDAGNETVQNLFETRQLRFEEVSQRLSVALATVELKVRLEKAALTDGLTNICNRRAFEQAVIRSIARSRRHQLPFALILLDIDHFKTINDTHGHEAGDQVLTRISTIMQNMTRTSDELGRIGGEEFCILLEGASEDEAVLKAEGLRAAIEAAELVPSKIVTGSFGVVHSSSLEVSSWKSLYNAADRALYAAKNSGRNRVVLSES